ncbi:MAG: 4Fe-4S binding protein [Dehalobacter sp.]|nr:4Fe-4S binding protein [Dehalobacter sp.]
MIRKIIEIDQEKCNSCGLCVNACREGALQLVHGKAVLVSDAYCDGLGDCLPECPTGAIQIIKREAADYNEELVKAKLARKKEKSGCSCPGTMATMIEEIPADQKKQDSGNIGAERPSELRQWPVQLNLINPQASYLQNADLLIAADCTAYAYASFHEKFMKDRITLIGCPKLDDNDYYTEKITEIIRINHPQSVKVARIDVPCCSGIVRAVKTAMVQAGISVPYDEVIIDSQGNIL